MSQMAERGTKMAWEQQVQTATAASEWISVVRWATLLSFTYSYHLWETEICAVQCPILVGFFLSILFRFYLFWGDECFRKINTYIPATALESKVKRTESCTWWCDVVDPPPTEWEKRVQGFDAPDLTETLRMLCPLSTNVSLPWGMLLQCPKSPAGDCHCRAAGSDWVLNLEAAAVISSGSLTC